MFEEYLKSLIFDSNRTYPKFTILVHFGAQFTPGKTKILLKIKISPKTLSLGLLKK